MDLKKQITRNKLEARKRFLTRFDYINFGRVPDFIVNAFFDDCYYQKRLIVANFAFLNGITFDQVVELVHWKGKSSKDLLKVKDLIEKYLPSDEYKAKYYSYSVVRGCVMFLDGRVRYFGNKI